MWWLGMIVLLVVALAIGGVVGEIIGGQAGSFVVEALILLVWVGLLIRRLATPHTQP